MILTERRLNRTLLLRQHLLSRVAMTPAEMIEHLVGLQAQDQLPPFFALAARLESLDPYALSAQLEASELVRLSSLRSTIHMHTAADAALIRAWTQPVHDYYTQRVEIIRPAAQLPGFVEATEDVLALGALPNAALEAGLVDHFPGVPAKALGLRARNELPLVQLPPRGLWKGSGGLVYDLLPRWTGVSPVEVEDVVPSLAPEIVRRFLRAFGPATAADITAWSSLTRLGPVIKRIDGLVTYRDEAGKTLYDVPDAPIATGEEHAPVRLLGTYDNLWLAHANRERITAKGTRKEWGIARGGAVILAGGHLVGLWKPVDGEVVVQKMLRDLTPDERDELAEETARVEALLAG
ncbi:winged helix DNA-binding protein [Nocardioides albertanoniae]|uniref:Winged helix DNA-binding protein n=1 Tax=Nocardioides albertanoniae TaxID=1175486 RepID=A0A543A599_9ACTN|nr:winged helix DNA-binding domain-containing protein [Nocardioides albertanoniae]TQL67728.1 winged helix DNA-binding protein [Nocardioides albertanoniae]